MRLCQAASGHFISIAFVLFSLVAAPAKAGSQTKYDPGLAAFPTTVNGEESPLRIRSVFVLPGESVAVSAPQRFRMSDRLGPVTTSASGRSAMWIAPAQPGVYPLKLSGQSGQSGVIIQAFVLVPYSSMKNGRLNGYRIGPYPAGEGIYQRPKGFVEVLPTTGDTWVSPHFQLKQFLCKQAGGFPKYILLSERLLTKLEVLLTAVNAKGVPADTFFIMSGYRTPAYNRSLRNVRLSRHQYGDAADVFIDQSKNGRMDDINGDGKVDARDADFLRQVVLELEADPNRIFAAGGVGHYSSTASHGPFVHIDARGHSAQWSGARYSKAAGGPSPRQARTPPQ